MRWYCVLCFDASDLKNSTLLLLSASDFHSVLPRRGRIAASASSPVVNINCLVKGTHGSELVNMASYAASLAAKP
jgi:hypothetical protein